jgi:hypothetical protein
MSVVVTKQINVEGITSTVCIEVSPGAWCWTTPGFNWKYNERIPPPAFNFGMQAGNVFNYQMRTKSIEDAVIYSVGFAYGYKNGHAHGEEDRAGVDGMVAQIRAERELQEATGLPPTTTEKA